MIRECTNTVYPILDRVADFHLSLIVFVQLSQLLFLTYWTILCCAYVVA